MHKPQSPLARRLVPETRGWIRIVDAIMVLLAPLIAAIESARVA